MRAVVKKAYEKNKERRMELLRKLAEEHKYLKK